MENKLLFSVCIVEAAAKYLVHCEIARHQRDLIEKNPEAEEEIKKVCKKLTRSVDDAISAGLSEIHEK